MVTFFMTVHSLPWHQKTVQSEYQRVVSGELVARLEGHTGVVSCVAFSFDRTRFVSGPLYGTTRTWDPVFGECLQTSELPGQGIEVSSHAPSPDGANLVSGSTAATIPFYETTSGTYRKSLRGDYGSVTSFALSSDDVRLAYNSNYTSEFWDVRTATCTSRPAIPYRSGNFAFSANGAVIVSSSTQERVLRFWDYLTGQAVTILQDTQDTFLCAPPPLMGVT